MGHFVWRAHATITSWYSCGMGDMGVGAVMTVRVVYSMPESEYRAGRMLSQSTAHTMLSKSPYHADRALREPRRQTESMRLGSLIDEIISGGDRLAIVEADNYRTRRAQEQRDSAIAIGRVPVLRHEYTGAVAIAGDLKRQLQELDGFPVLSDLYQVSLFWEEMSSSGRVVQCRARLDNLSLPFVIDFKRIKSADDSTCVAHMIRYGYDIQAASYIRGVERCIPEWAGRLTFLDAFLEIGKQPPYMVNALEMDGEFLAMGAQKWQRAVDLWARCEESGEWPGYTTRVRKISAPGYALSRHESAMAEASEQAIEEW